MNCKPIYFRGKYFETIKEAAAYYDIPYYAVMNRRNIYGWSLEKTFDEITIPRKINSVDHLGQKFESMTDMAHHWGMHYQILRTRLNRGWSIKRALTTPVKGKYKKIIVQGKEFKSIAEAARYFDIPLPTVYARMRLNHWKLDTIFLLPVIEKQNHKRRAA